MNYKIWRFWLMLAVAVLFCSGCADVRGVYHEPEIKIPGQWEILPGSGEQVLGASQWWLVFDDPVLNQLIVKALETNNDLAAAAFKLKKARLQLELAQTGLGPDYSASASAGTRKNLETHARSNSYSTSAGLSWEPDLWGKLAATRDSAEWEAKATEQDLANTALSLIGTTAELYWQIAYLNQAITTSREGIAYTLETLKIVRSKYNSGAVSELDLVQAQQNVESQKSELAGLNRQMAQARHALAILFNQAPEGIMADPKRLTDMPLPAIDPGIPAAVLGNRPDLMAAEMRLRSLRADADATRASYYPTWSLTASLGTSSTTLLNILSNPVAALGAGVSLPFVQWQDMKINTEISEIEYEQAVVEFRQTLYEALQDVADCLSDRKHYMEQETALRTSLELAKKAEHMARVRYREGTTGVQDWLDQQETRRSADLSLAENRYNQLKNLMTLYQALGGDTNRLELN